MKYYIVTGSSRGLGHALVRELAGEGRTVVAISRSGTDVEGLARRGGEVVDLQRDLSNTDAVDGVMDDVFARIDVSAAEGLYLINNAGLVDPVAPVERQALDDVVLHMSVNLIAPMRLMARFIALTEQAQCRKVVANVSSSAGGSPYRGWGPYCAAKAGLNMFGRVAGLEQRQRPDAAGSPVIVYAVAPGKVDTGMQARLRDLTEADFPDHAAFVQYKERGELSSPEHAARLVAATLDSPKIASGDVIDVRDFEF